MEIMYEVRQKISNHPVLTAPRLTTTHIDTNPRSLVTKEYLDLRIPKPPTTGEYTLKSINGVVSWVLN